MPRFINVTAWDGRKYPISLDDIDQVFISEAYRIGPTGLVPSIGEPLRVVCLKMKDNDNFTIQESAEDFEALLLAAQGNAN
jgi:hypothetical protein